MLNWKDFVLVFLAVCFYFWWKWKPMRDLAAKIPGPKGLPAIGCLHKFIGIKAEDFYTTIVKIIKPYQHEKCFKAWFGPWLVFVAMHPEDVKIILNSEDCLVKPKVFYGALLYGLISMNGEEYKLHRKTVNPVFSPKSLQNILPLTSELANEFLLKFDSILKTETFDISQITLNYSLGSILTAFFDPDKVDEKNRLKQIHDNDRNGELETERAFKPWYKLDIFNLTQQSKDLIKIKRELVEFVELLIQDHEKEYQMTKTKNFTTSQVFLDLYYTLRDEMTYQQTLESILMFVEGGFDTSGKTIAGVLLLLAMNQDEQEKVVNEIQTVLTSDTDEIDGENLGKMVYLDLVIKETLRLMPQALVYAREASNDVKLETCTIPKGTLILLAQKEMHLDKDLWGEDALEFNPERFSEENIKKVHQYAYFPFSNGPRICPGIKYGKMSMKVFLSKFLMKYRVTTELKYEDLEFIMKVTTVLKQGFMVKVERR